MKNDLRLQLGAGLKLTPQLRQSIRLLGMSLIEIEAEIQQAVETNPLLEHRDDANEMAVDIHENNNDALASDTDDLSIEIDDGIGQTMDEMDNYQFTDTESFHADAVELAGNAQEGLQTHLAWQLQLSSLSDKDKIIGQWLIDRIDDEGYIRDSIKDVHASIHTETKAGIDQIETVRHLIQHFDPVGCACLSLSECLLVQLKQEQLTNEDQYLLQQLIQSYLTDLARMSIDELATRLNIDPRSVAHAVQVIKSLDPKPGLRFSNVSPTYIKPDAVAVKRNNRWDAISARSEIPLSINSHYVSLIGKSGSDGDNYLRAQLLEARWLIKNLSARNHTILRVAQIIVETQHQFFDFGTEAMRPLTLRQVAERLELHESTISRASSRKYLRTPRGTFEFRYFFGSGVIDEQGDATSAMAISAKIRRLIEQENPKKPLSDAKLTALLNADGVPVARRTVAKYREAMNIASSTDRQRLN